MRTESPNRSATIPFDSHWNHSISTSISRGASVWRCGRASDPIARPARAACTAAARVAATRCRSPSAFVRNVNAPSSRQVSATSWLSRMVWTMTCRSSSTSRRRSS